MPKEMLPVVDKPLIQYAVEEAAAAGVTEMIFVTGRNKRAIEDHFDTYAELERELEMKGKQELLEIVREIWCSLHLHSSAAAARPRSCGVVRSACCRELAFRRYSC